MGFKIGDEVTYAGGEYQYQWDDNGPIGTVFSPHITTIMGETWVGVRFPSGESFNYPASSLIPAKPAPMSPEFDLAEIELAEILMEEMR